MKTDDAASWRARLRHVYRIGGGSGAGKSTVARRLAAHHCLRVLSTDEMMADHGARMTPEANPYLAVFSAMDIDERWLARSAQAAAAPGRAASHRVRPGRLASPDARPAAFAHRGSPWQIAHQTSDPERALGNLLQRDAMFTERLARGTRQLGLRAVEVDTRMTEEELAEQVAESPGISPVT